MNKEDRYISPAVVRRLPRYYRHLGELKERGITRISSRELSENMGITASQIRQDLNHFGGFGQQGYGYNVEYLHLSIGQILGLDHPYHMIIIGAGNLGSAMACFSGFGDHGFFFDAMFDLDPRLIGSTIGGCPVLSVERLEEYIQEHAVDIAILTLPKDSSRSVAERVVQAGVPAIWNFAPTDLKLPNSDVIIENVHLTDSLMTLSYKLERKTNEI